MLLSYAGTRVQYCPHSGLGKRSFRGYAAIPAREMGWESPTPCLP